MKSLEKVAEWARILWQKSPKEVGGSLRWYAHVETPTVRSTVVARVVCGHGGGAFGLERAPS